MITLKEYQTGVLGGHPPRHHLHPSVMPATVPAPRPAAWSETGIMETFPSGGLKVRWRAPVGRGWSSPVVAQGRVYVTDVELVRPTAKERVLCFEEANGKLLWSHEYAVEHG